MLFGERISEVTGRRNVVVQGRSAVGVGEGGGGNRIVT